MRGRYVHIRAGGGTRWIVCHAAVFLSTLLLVFSHMTIAGPQEPDDRQSRSTPPTFRTATKLIDIDVFVTDGSGQFVKSLKRDDFEIIEDGKHQEPDTFAFIDWALPSGQLQRSADEPEPDVVTNAVPPERLYVVLMDSPSTWSPPEAINGLAYTVIAQRVAKRFIDDFLQPGDLAAVVHVQGGVTDGQSFTSSKALLRTSIERFGQGLSGDPSGTVDAPELVRRHLDSFRALHDISERLGVIGRRRKVVLWIGAQLRYQIPECRGGRGLGCELNSRWGTVAAAYRDAIAAATRNNVVIYPIDPAGLTTETGAAEMDRRSALQVVAEDSGGTAVVGTNDFGKGFETVVRENSTYYVLGYSPPKQYDDGKFHEVQVRVKRRGDFVVRTRKGYLAGTASAVKNNVAPSAPTSVPDATRDALRLPISISGLELGLFSAPFKGTAQEQLVIIGGTVKGALDLKGAQKVALAYQVHTLDNHLQTGEYQVLNLSLQPDSRERAIANGLHFVQRIALPPGRYEIRYVVEQPGGAIGSVVAPLVVPRFDGQLSLSGLLLVPSNSGPEVMLRDEPQLRKLLGTSPTSARVFAPRQLIALYGEAYSDDEGRAAGDLQVNAILRTASGEEIHRERAGVIPGDRLRRPFIVQMSLPDVPGQYLLTVEASEIKLKAERRIAIVVR